LLARLRTVFYKTARQTKNNASPAWSNLFSSKAHRAAVASNRLPRFLRDQRFTVAPAGSFDGGCAFAQDFFYQR
jgi:hypothetical protein